MKNNKGFAISGIMYAILIISLLLVVGTLKTLQNRKTIIDKVKLETVNAVDSNNYQQLLTRIEALEDNLNSLATKVNKKCVLVAYVDNSFVIGDSTGNNYTDYVNVKGRTAANAPFDGTDNDHRWIKLNKISSSNSENCGMQLQNGKVIVTDSNISKILVSGSAYFTKSPVDTRIGLNARVDNSSNAISQVFSSIYNGNNNVSMDHQHLNLSPRYFTVTKNSSIGLSVVAMKNGSTLTINGATSGTFLTIEVIE